MLFYIEETVFIMKISLCIPIYNEESILHDTVETLSSYMQKTFVEDYEIIFINDGSKDRSLEILSSVAQKIKNIRVVTYDQNQGKGYAVRQGVLQSNGKIIIFTDCDLAYGTDVIRQMFDMFEKYPSYDVIIGSRKKHPEGYEGYTRIRKFVSHSYIRILSLIGGIKVSDFQCGCKGFRAETGKKIFEKCIINRFAFDIEVLTYAHDLNAGIGEMPVKIINHRNSTVHIVRDSIKILKDISIFKKHRQNEIKKKKENESKKKTDL